MDTSKIKIKSKRNYSINSFAKNYKRLNRSSGSIENLVLRLRILNPNVAKVGGLQSQGAKGEAVVVLLRTLGNAGSEVLRLSRRVKKMETNRSILRILRWLLPENTAKPDLD